MAESLGSEVVDTAGFQIKLRFGKVLMSSLLHVIVVLWFASVPLMFMILKIIQRHLEILQDADPTVRSERHRFLHACLEGFCRRIINPSFWAFIGLTFASILIARAVAIVRPRAAKTLGTWNSNYHLLAWCITTVVMGTGYLTLVAFKHETFFYNHDGETIQLIQRIEGVLNISAYLFGPVMLAVGLSCLDFIRKALHDEDCKSLPDVVEASALLYSAGWGPLLVVAVAQGGLGFLSAFLPIPKNWFGGDLGSFMDSPLGRAITAIFIGIIFLPFIYLGLNVKKNVKDRISFAKKTITVPDIGKILLKILKAGDILSGEWYSGSCNEDLATLNKASTVEPAAISGPNATNLSGVSSKDPLEIT